MTLLTTVASIFTIGISSVCALHTVTIHALDNSTAISYTGSSWGAFNGCINGTDYTYTKNEGFTFSFVGVSIAVFGTASQPGGVITTTFDYQTQDTFDRYRGDGRFCDVTLFRRDGLINGTHTLTMALTGNSPANSTTNGFIEWQYLTYTVLDPSDVFGTSIAALPTSISSVIPTADSTAMPVPTPTSIPQSSNAAAIGGGVAGGIIVAALLGFLVWWYCIRKKYHNHVRPDLDGPGNAPAPAPAPSTYWPGRFDREPLLVTPAYEPKPLDDASESGRLSYSMVDDREFDSAMPMGIMGTRWAAPPSSVGGSTSIPDSDVDRIAARVASLIGRPPGSTPPTSATSQQFPTPHLQGGPSSMGHDQPPPMYIEKGPR